jgi:hypothetical protein
MSEFIGPEASAWDSKLDKQYELLRLEATYDIGSLALWRCLEDLNVWRVYLVDNDPNYHDNRAIYNNIITGGGHGIPQ